MTASRSRRPSPSRRLTTRAEAVLARLAPRAPRTRLWATTGRVVLAAPGHAVAKCYDDAAPLRAELAGLDAARAAGLPVSALLAFEEEPPAVLVTAWVDGAPLHEAPPAAVRDAGRLLRLLHAAPIRPPVTGPPRPWDEMVAGWASDEAARAAGLGLLPPRAVESARARFAALRPLLRERPPAVTHGDLQPEHVLVDPRRERVVAFLDWADAGIRDPAWDLAVLTLTHLYLEPDLLAGYGERPSAELLDAYRLLRHLGAAAWLEERALHDEARESAAAARRLLAATPTSSGCRPRPS